MIFYFQAWATAEESARTKLDMFQDILGDDHNAANASKPTSTSASTSTSSSSSLHPSRQSQLVTPHKRKRDAEPDEMDELFGSVTSTNDKTTVTSTNKQITTTPKPVADKEMTQILEAITNT